MTGTHLFILLGLALAVGVLIWLTPNGTPTKRDFDKTKGDAGDAGASGSDWGGS